MKYAAGLAIDLDYETRSFTVPGTDGKSWLKITLDKTHCVKTVIWFMEDRNAHLTWTCTENDCSNCEGDYCSYYTLTVSTEGAVSDLSPVSDCKYGDTVKLEKVIDEGFYVYEMVAVGKQGNVYEKHFLT